MKLYLINLDRSLDRLQRLENIFSQLNLNFIRVQAVDGKLLEDPLIEKLTQQRTWYEPLTRGEIACFLSHKSALQLVADGKDNYAAIFEDDVTLSTDAAEFLSNEDWIPKTADIVKIETHGKKVWLGKAQKLKNEHSISRLKSRHIMAAAYIVSKTAAKRLVNLMEQATAPFDHYLFNPKFQIFEKFEMWQLDPAIVIQANLKSTLEGDRLKLKVEKKQKRTLSKTLLRETKRIFSRAKVGIWGMYINFFTHEKWKRIKYKK